MTSQNLKKILEESQTHGKKTQCYNCQSLTSNTQY